MPLTLGLTVMIVDSCRTSIAVNRWAYGPRADRRSCAADALQRVGRTSASHGWSFFSPGGTSQRLALPQVRIQLQTLDLGDRPRVLT